MKTNVNKYIFYENYGILEIISKQYGKHKVYFDLEDYDLISNYHWRLQPDKCFNTHYAITKDNILMHRLILSPEKSKVIDHKNHNGLDNRKQNLKICTQLENMQNQRLRKTNKSGYSNISYEKERNKWLVKFVYNKKVYKIGRYNTIEEALLVRNNFIKEMKGGEDLSELITIA